jgi:hypothetical protein
VALGGRVRLKAGDVMTLGVGNLGTQKQKVVPFKGKRWRVSP